MGSDIWINTLDTESYIDSQKLLEVEFLPIEIKLIPIIFTILAVILSLIFFKYYVYIIYWIYLLFFYMKVLLKKKYKLNINIYKLNILIKYINIFKFFFNAYYFNEIYNSYIYKIRNLGYVLFKNLDKGFIEWIGPMFIVNLVQKLKILVSKKNKGLIDHYVFIMIFGLFTIIILIYFLEIWIYDLKIFSLILIIILLEIYKKKI